MTAAHQARRLRQPAEILDRLDEETGQDGSLKLIPLDPQVIMPAARKLVMDNYPLRTLDAIHLAVALHGTADLVDGEPVTFVTRDQRQAEAAKANGLEVR